MGPIACELREPLIQGRPYYPLTTTGIRRSAGHRKARFADQSHAFNIAYPLTEPNRKKDFGNERNCSRQP